MSAVAHDPEVAFDCLQFDQWRQKLVKASSQHGFVEAVTLTLHFAFASLDHPLNCPCSVCLEPWSFLRHQVAINQHFEHCFDLTHAIGTAYHQHYWAWPFRVHLESCWGCHYLEDHHQLEASYQDQVAKPTIVCDCN